ncbi:MAG: amidohydrolase family protein [Parvularculaceae bacterium]
MAACASYPEGSASKADFIIENVTVVSPERKTALEHANVAIENGRIAAVTKSNFIGKSSVTVDGRGLYLIPGLIDSHVHLYNATGLRRQYARNYQALYDDYMEQLPRSYLYYGYTTLLELNANTKTNARFLSEPDHPDLFHCSQGLILHNGFMASELPTNRLADIYPNYLHDSYGKAPLPEGARPEDHNPESVVRKVTEAGGICVKMYYEEALWAGDDKPDYELPSKQIISDVVKAAHAHKMPVVLHATSPAGFKVGLYAGVDIFAHGPWDWPGVKFDDPKIPDDIEGLVERLANSPVSLQPTMRTIRNAASLFEPKLLNDPALNEVLPPRYLEYLRTDAQAQRDAFLNIFGKSLPPGASEDEIAGLQKAFNSRYERLVGLMDAAGVELLFGTDTAVGGFGWGNPPGLNGYWEMQGWARGGVSLRTIFNAATIRNAKAFHLDQEIGTIERGKRANLLLLRSNPLKSIAAYDTITDIFIDGKRIKRADLSAASSQIGN